MSREINVSEAADWSDEDYELNAAYLESRGRLADLDEVRRLREGPEEPSDDTRGDLAGYGEKDQDVQDGPQMFPAEAPIHEQTKKAKKGAKSSGDGVPDGTVGDVLEWVGDDTDRAQQALDAENARDNPRVSLVDALEELTE